MKRLLCALACIALLVGCAPMIEPASEDINAGWVQLGGSNSVRRYIDREAGVVCYIADGFESIGIDCLPCSQTNLDCGE